MAVKLALVGLGGYGLVYLEGLLDQKKTDDFEIVAGIDPEPQRCTRLQELKAMNVPIFHSMDEFFNKGTADLVIISSPIQMHLPQTCFALSQGANVLCEKPLGATIQEAGRMIKARDDAKKFVAIGYQWSFSDAIQALKRDIQSGLFGSPKRLKTMVLWPRGKVYYSRNNWAGKLKDEKGHWILDSPANNAFAHYLHNMFYVLGDQVDSSAKPGSVAAELYRANPIETFDTFAARVVTQADVEILFYGSHAIEEETGPIITYEFEEATVDYNGRNSNMVAHFSDGSKKNYGAPDDDQVKKMWDAIRAVQTGEKIVCGPEAASSQTLCVNGMQESMPEIVNFPDEQIFVCGEIGDKINYVKGLKDSLFECYEKNALPGELGFEWSKNGKEIDLRDYHEFPMEPYQVQNEK
ncbi:MAG: Gfo/Idh/MocA family oxidoreductase [Calditrichaeota bacterium]|nr:Gfo/Idh/MocA family oxidoreductase [Calditrichota bacterium]